MFLNSTEKVIFKGETDINSSEYGGNITIGEDGFQIGGGIEYSYFAESVSVERDGYYIKNEIGAEIKLGFGIGGEFQVGPEGVYLKANLAFLVGIEIDFKLDFKFENWFRG